LGIGSKLNSAYLFRKQEIGTKPSAPTIDCFLKTKTDYWAIVPNFSYLDIAPIWFDQSITIERLKQ